MKKFKFEAIELLDKAKKFLDENGENIRKSNELLAKFKKHESEFINGE